MRAPEQATRGEPRLIQLDILRGAAILLVLLTHTILATDRAGSLSGVLGYVSYYGPTGVDLFFVLSGFLVGGLLFKELQRHGRLDVRRFLIRRAFRIWPSYFAFLALALGVMLVVENESPRAALGDLLPNLVHLQNYLGSPREHTWSLAVEEHFYLALPLLLLAATGRARGAVRSIPVVPVAAGLLIVGAALLRLRAYAGDPGYNPHYATHLRVDGLFFGVLLAYLYHFHPHRLAFVARHRARVVAASAALLAPFPLLVIHDQSNMIVGSVGFTMVFVAYGGLLLAMVVAPEGAGWAATRFRGGGSRLIARVGYFSYPIYLVHIDTRLLAQAVDRRVLETLPAELRWLGAFATFVVVAVAAGTIFGLVLEKPSLALRNRLFPSRVGTATTGDYAVDRAPSPPPVPVGAALPARAPA